MRFIAKWATDARGASAIEYSLIAAGIAMAVVALVQVVGSDVKSKFTAARDALESDYTASIKVREDTRK